MSKPNQPQNGKCWCADHKGSGDWLPVEQFTLIEKDNPSRGYQWKCRECATVYHRDWSRRKQANKKNTAKRALERRQEKEDQMLETIAGIIQDVQGCDLTDIERNALSAKLRAVVALYWEII